MKLTAIRENHLYLKAYRNGKKAGGRTVTVYLLRDLHADRLRRENPLKQKINRVGINASKKIGGAVQRNRAKRVIREAYRSLDKCPGIRKGFLVVITAHEAATVCQMQDVLRDMQKCFQRLGLLVDPGNGQPAATDSGKSGL